MTSNSDMPAMPQSDSMAEQWIDPTDTSKGTYYATGLTKLEHFAGLAMQGFLSNSVMGDSNLHDSASEWKKDIAESSVEFANALLSQLDKVSDDE